MKKDLTLPTVEIVEVNSSDVITTSGTYDPLGVFSKDRVNWFED